MLKEIKAKEFKEKFLNNKERLELIDVREKDEFDQIKVIGSKLISMGELAEKLDKIDWNKQVIFICRTGSRSGYVTKILNEKGYNSTNLSGGINILRLNCDECIKEGKLDKKYFDFIKN